MNINAALVFLSLMMAGQVSTSVPATEAAKYAGKKQTVCGAVAGVRREATGGKEDLFLDLERPYPDSVLTVVVTKQVVGKFVKDFETRAPKLSVCATGKIEGKTMLSVRVDNAKDIRGFLPPASAPPQSERFGGTLPRVIREGKPRYTSAALAARVEGRVEIAARVGVDGTLSDFRVVRSLDALFGLDEAAIQAASEWTFEPARYNGQPVPFVVTIQLEFKLH